ncbi:MAG: hypothetical protein EXR77_07995 [Myxococcales bacterium]|nr:hypothetical protein [Myxococcales bacterium]
MSDQLAAAATEPSATEEAAASTAVPSETTQEPTAEPASDDAVTKTVDDRDAIEALKQLPPRLFARLCRRIPLRAFLAELDKLDRSVFFRYFKGVRPQKIDGPYLERVFRLEIFGRNDGILAQLAIYNWDEAESRVYADLQIEVKKINEDVEAIEHINDEQGNAICDTLVALYDPRDVYIAFVINGVRVDPGFYARRFPTMAG